MPIAGIDHVNIRTADLDATVRFYAEVFDLRYRPGSINGFAIHWLYDAADHPVVHLTVVDRMPAPPGTIDHVAFACRGRQRILERLEVHGVEARVVQAVPGVTQVFLRDPQGVPLELSFRGDDGE